jgi:peptidoglycan/LPS O-acetylase OafA/YrhL
MIKSLSSLRFVFAVLVFLLHIHKINIAIGHAFFIVLSGFILTKVYENKIIDNTFSFSDFFKKRLARTYPLHILTLLLAIPLSLAGIKSETGVWLSKFIFNLFSLQVFVPSNQFYFSFNGVAWNLAVLLVFYACFPFLIRGLSKISFLSFSLTMGLIVMFISFSMAIIPEKWHHYLFYISPYYRIFDFIFGIYLFQLTKKLTFRPGFKMASLFEIGAVILCVLLYIATNSEYDNLKPYIYSLYLWIPLAAIFIGFHYDKGVISKYILSSKLMLRLGNLSFSFYMIHQLVIRYFRQFNDDWQLDRANSHFYN